MRNRMRAVVLTAVLGASAAVAQDEAAPQDQPPRQPRAALMMPLAVRSTLLDVALAGTRQVAVGIHGDILVSDDGKAWRQVLSPVDVMLTRVYFRDATHGWAVGYDGTILATEDGGLNWKLQRWVADKGPLYDILFVDEHNGLAVGSYGAIVRTVDGGASWAPLKVDISEPGLHFNALTRLADGTLFLAGERGMMARSADNGSTWALLDSPYRGSMFGALPQGAHGVLVFGLRGNLYIADDARAARTTPVSGWDEFDRTTTADPAALGWRHVDNASVESLLRGYALADGSTLLTGISGVVLRVPATGSAAQVLKSSENETLSGLLPGRPTWTAVGLRGVRPLPLQIEAQP